MISLRNYKEYKNRLKFDVFIKDWNNYNGRMLEYNSKIIEIKVFSILKAV
jgi:hypothetical protein